MAQAKILTGAELKRALAVIAQRRHAQRDRLALLLTHWAGMRVCDVAALTLDKIFAPHLILIALDHMLQFFVRLGRHTLDEAGFLVGQLLR